MSISCLHFLIGHGFPHLLSVWETLTPVCKTGDTRMIKIGLIGLSLTVKLLHYTYNTHIDIRYVYYILPVTKLDENLKFTIK